MTLRMKSFDTRYVQTFEILMLPFLYLYVYTAKGTEYDAPLVILLFPCQTGMATHFEKIKQSITAAQILACA